MKYSFFFFHLRRPLPPVLDMQAAVADGVATPLFGSSALLGPMVRADGWFCVPEADTGLAAGAEVDVRLYG